MATLRLAGTLISNTEGTFNWGHLQILNAETGQEIEVQSWANPTPGDPANTPYFQYNLPRSHALFTDFAPGSINADPANYSARPVPEGLPVRHRPRGNRHVLVMKRERVLTLAT